MKGFTVLPLVALAAALPTQQNTETENKPLPGGRGFGGFGGFGPGFGGFGLGGLGGLVGLPLDIVGGLAGDFVGGLLGFPFIRTADDGTYEIVQKIDKAAAQQAVSKSKLARRNEAMPGPRGFGGGFGGLGGVLGGLGGLISLPLDLAGGLIALPLDLVGGLIGLPFIRTADDGSYEVVQKIDKAAIEKVQAQGKLTRRNEAMPGPRGFGGGLGGLGGVLGGLGGLLSLPLDLAGGLIALPLDLVGGLIGLPFIRTVEDGSYEIVQKIDMAAIQQAQAAAAAPAQ